MDEPSTERAPTRPSRAHRRALAGAAAALLLVGAIAVVVHDDGSPRREVRAGAADDPTTTTEGVTSTSTSTTIASVDGSTTTLRPTTTSTTATDGQVIDGGPCCVLRGQAVDPQGHPLAGINIYRDVATSGPIGRTDADGRYVVSCPRVGVVLSGVWLNGFVQDHRDDRNWMPSTVLRPDGRPLQESCGTDGLPAGTDVPPAVVTTLQPGGIVTGTYDDPANPPFDYVPGPGGTTASVLVELAPFPLPSGEGPCLPFCIYVEGLVGADQRYTILGVPSGVHAMSTFNLPKDQFPAVTVVAGQTTEHDLVVPPPAAP